MPVPSGSDMALLAKQRFAKEKICLPDGFDQFFPRDGIRKRQFTDAFPLQERNVPPVIEPPDLLFDRYLPLRAFAEQQATMSRCYAEFIDQICAAISAAWDSWQQTVKLTGVTYTAGTAFGGQIVGAPFSPTIIARGPNSPWTAIIANALTAAWTQFELSLRLVGAPLFIGNMSIPIPPGGDAQPGLPGVSGPVPFKIAFPSAAPILKTALVGLMEAVSPPEAKPGRPPLSLGPHTKVVYEAIATAVTTSFDLWTASSMVESSSFLLIFMNPSLTPIPRMAGMCPSTIAPFLVTPKLPPTVYTPQPWQIQSRIAI